MINVLLRAFAVILIGLVTAFIGFIIGSMFFAITGLVIYGREGYEAGGPIGFILGALIGLVASSARVFGGRREI